jgi:alkylhydroperoxidase/carboxymuconolactone decarboxylase family protein YurZ
VAALIPLDVAPQLKGHVQGALNVGNTDDQLWKLYDVIARLFNEGHETRVAKRVFEDVLGKKLVSEEELREDREWRGL